VKIPTTKAGWASVALGLGLILCGCAHWLQGNHAQACLDFSGAFGTLGLPSLAGTGYHVEIARDVHPPRGTFR
jgi:hypothetical protein